MLKTIKVCSFDFLLEHAQKLNHNWNAAHKLLEGANLHVGYLSKDHYKDSTYCEATEHIEARAILKDFMNTHNLEEFYITPKYYEC